jgi:hypothetical protein
MPPKLDRKPRDGEQWQKEMSARLTAERQSLGSLGAAPKVMPRPGEPGRLPLRAAGVEPLSMPDSPRSELRALTLGKNQPADFMPQRHVYMVRGRPVLVRSG